MDFLPTLLPTRQVDTPPTRKLNRRAADILILFNVFNRNFIPPGCGLVLIFDLREVKWCGFSSCLEWVGADFWSAWCGLVRTGADFCYWLVRLVDSRATLCSLGLYSLGLVLLRPCMQRSTWEKFWRIDHCAKISAQWLHRDLQHNNFFQSGLRLCA